MAVAGVRASCCWQLIPETEGQKASSCRCGTAGPHLSGHVASGCLGFSSSLHCLQSSTFSVFNPIIAVLYCIACRPPPSIFLPLSHRGDISPRPKPAQSEPPFRNMHPKAQLAPKKLGIQGGSKTKKVASPPTFTREELRELRRLSATLPPSRRAQSPTDTVHNAAVYIQQLVATVHARVANGTLPLEVLAQLGPQNVPAPPRKAVRRSIEKKH